MTTAISRRIPPQRLINALNPLVRVALESPLHAALDNALLVLHVYGRKTNRRFDIPIGYAAVQHRLITVTQHTWRVNLRGGADIDVTYRGHRHRMRADLDEDPTTVAADLRTIIDLLGAKAAERRLGLILHGRTPGLAELEDAVRAYHLSTVTLTPPTTDREPTHRTGTARKHDPAGR
ncbi:hypothetical protein [Microlunatus ginsengisoli]|uniref:DUF385 domain-containing protein n=1 Tax=Microlunatus ginsengisoli TaxID=363863 RepID=A0ABP7ARB9_9ACTN